MTTHGPPDIPRTARHFIDGEWIDSDEEGRRRLLDPATEEVIGTVPEGTAADVDAAVLAARRAFSDGRWRGLSLRERARALRRVGELMMDRADEIAAVETLDQGKPLRLSRRMMVPLAAAAWEFFAGALMTFGGRSVRPRPGISGHTLEQPIGVVGCITPGNVPLVLGSEKLAPALAVGNSVVLKPPPECPLSSVLLGECIQEAGIPDGVFNLVHGDGDPVGETLVTHADVGMIAFTGSTATGRTIMAAAAGRVKRVLLELGGKAPMLVLADADIEAAVEGALWACFMNSGQICMAATRLLLHESVHDEFASRFVARTRELRLGPGMDEDTDLGPLVTRAARDRVEEYIAAGIDAGATVLCGGVPLRDGRFERGFWVQPTVFDDVSADMRIVREEIFGPVPVLQRFGELEEGLALANDTPFGLTGSVWTRDLDTALEAAERIEAGYVWVNDHLVRAPDLPFGGWKQSGLGREATAATLSEFCQTKSVYVDRSGAVRKPRYGLVARTAD